MDNFAIRAMGSIKLGLSLWCRGADFVTWLDPLFRHSSWRMSRVRHDAAVGFGGAVPTPLGTLFGWHVFSDTGMSMVL